MRILIFFSAILLAVPAAAQVDLQYVDAPDTTYGGRLPDTDNDRMTDVWDNCVQVKNASQTDTDCDGPGNACDADFDNDGLVTPLDLGMFRQLFFTDDEACDLNSDGIVNTADLGYLRAGYFQAPGPTGYCAGGGNCAGPTPTHFSIDLPDSNKAFTVKVVDEGIAQHARAVLHGGESEYKVLMGEVVCDSTVDYNPHFNFYIKPETVGFTTRSHTYELCNASVFYLTHYCDSRLTPVWCIDGGDLFAEAEQP